MSYRGLFALPSIVFKEKSLTLYMNIHKSKVMKFPIGIQQFEKLREEDTKNCHEAMQSDTELLELEKQFYELMQGICSCAFWRCCCRKHSCI